jgi:TPR repeat protein
VRARSLLVSLILLVVILAMGTALLSARVVHWPVWAIAAAAAGVTALAGIVKPAVDALMKARVDRLTDDGANQRKLGDALAKATGSRAGLPLIGDVRSRSVLGVHPAIPLPADADPALSNELPTYVPRDIDSNIQSNLSHMSATGGFLLLVGEPASGKTRSAVEALRGLPRDWRMYIRSGSTTLQQLIDAGASLERTVIWLDDIHQLLDSDSSDPAHLTATLVRRLLLPASGPVIIIATTWPDRRDRYTRQPSEGVPDLMSDARSVIEMAQQIDIDAEFSNAEWARAVSLSSEDPRLGEAVSAGGSRTLAATLANRDELIRRWRFSGKPIVSALISAAIDARRCGYPEPIPEGVIAELVPHYLSPSQRARAGSEWLQSALSEACEPIRGDTRPMQSAASYMSRIDGYEVSDILLDYTKNSQQIGPVPQVIWETLLAAVIDPSVLYSIGAAAYFAGKPEMAMLSFERAADAGNVSAINGLGFLMYYAGDHAGCELYFKRAADAGYPAALNNLGGLLARSGNTEKAEVYYQQAIDAGHMPALTNMGFLLEGRGNIRAAERYYRWAAEAGSPDALNNLGTLLANRGEFEEAEAHYRRAAHAGSIDALNNLGTLLAARNDRATAEVHYRKAVDLGNVDALNNLGVLLAADGNFEEAEQYYRRAIDAGSIDAYNGLGNLLANRGELQEAELSYRRAAESGNADALNSLGVLLAGRGETADAEKYYRRAAEAGSADALNNLGAILADRGATAAAEEYYLQAIVRGSSDALCGMGILLAGLNKSEESAPYYAQATDESFRLILDKLAALIYYRTPGLGNRDRKISHPERSAREDSSSSLNSLAWLRAAASVGSTRAMVIIADHAMNNAEKEEALSWYDRAANQGDLHSVLRLAHLLGMRAGLRWLLRASKAWKH